jgi:hypothetical protein
MNKIINENAGDMVYSMFFTDIWAIKCINKSTVNYVANYLIK